MFTKSKKGNIGEEYAARVLNKLGYKILSKNFHSRFGEIDIIAQHLGILKFIEVKARWSTKFGKPEEAITPHKIRNIKKTIDYYLYTNKIRPQNYQIEFVLIDLSAKGSPKFKIIKYL